MTRLLKNDTPLQIDDEILLKAKETEEIDIER